MITINCFTNGFANQPSSVSGKTPQLCQWVYFQNNFDGITIFEDGHIWQTNVDMIESPIKVGWLHEQRGLRPENYYAAWHLRNKFDFILTHDTDLLASDSNKFKLCIRGGVTIPREDWRMWPKSKNIAMLLSDKRETEGHKLRHEIAEKVKGIDVYRNASKEVLKDYRFVVVAESCREGHLFTEHLLDPIALGCVPIYWGTRYIGEYLKRTGILEFSNIAELSGLCESLDSQNSNAMYNGLAPYIQEMQEKYLERYEVTEDWMVRRYFL